MTQEEKWVHLVADVRKIADDLEQYVVKPHLAGVRPAVDIEASFFARFEMLTEDYNDVLFEAPSRNLTEDEHDALDDAAETRRERSLATGAHPYDDVFTAMGVKFYG